MIVVETVEERLKALMLDGLAGNEASYRRLLVDISGRLRSYYARRLGSAHEASEDLVQETLIAVHTRRLTYDVDRPFTAWLYAIARYKMIDHLRGSHARHTIPLESADDLVGPDEEGPAGARMDVDRLLRTMSPRSQNLVRAVKLEGRSVQDVSQETGISESAVKVAVHRALKMLSERIRSGKKP